MSDQDIRDQLEGLFSEISPEPEVEKPGAAAPQAEGADEIKSGIEEVEAVNVGQVDVSSPRQGTGPSRRVTHRRGPRPGWRHVRNWPMATRLTLVTLLLLMVTLAGTTFVTVRTARSTLSGQIGQNLEAQTDSLSDLIGVYFLEKASQLQAVAATDVVKQSLAERNAAYVGSPDEILAGIQALDKTWVAAADDDPLILNIITPDSTLNPVAHQLANFLATFPDHSETFVTDRYGATVAATGRLSDYYQADEGWWQASWNDGKGTVYLSDPEYDESAGVSATLIAVPVFDDETGEVIGVVRSTLNVDGLYKLVAARTFGQTGHALLLNGVGDIIFDPRAQAVDSAELPADLRQQFVAEVSNFIIAADQQGDSSLFASTHLREDSFASGATTTQNQIIQAVANLGWVTVVRQKASEALVSADQAVWSILLSGVVATLLVGLGLMFVTRATTRPLTTLSAAAEEIGAGNLDAPLPAPSGDEIGRLAASFGKMVAQLRQTLETLEQRVAERTRARMALAAAVGHRLSTVRDLDRLLSETVELIQESFDLYHAQVYLADPAGRYLHLRAGTGEVGAELVHRSHSLQIGQGSINGTAAALKQAVIVSDTSQSATFLPNPLLPDTRSEMAVPLLVGERVVGVLDLQSAQPGALAAENLPAFEALAGQLAIAIDNARLFSEAAQARAEVEAQLRQLTDTGWQEFLDGIERSECVGYAYQRGKLEAIVDPLAEPPTAHALAVPIQIQGASMGTIQIEGEAGRIWTQSDAELVETVVRQVAQQADNLRLLAQAEGYRAQAEQASRRLTREGWASFLETQATPVTGFTYDLSQVKPVTNGNDVREPALSRPLEVRGETIGHLAVGEVDALDEEATQLLTTVAERLSDHIENLRLLEEAQTHRYEVEERSRELEASQRVTFAASETSDPDEVLDLVVNLIRDQFDLYHAQVYLVDKERQAAVLRKSTGYAGRQLLEAGHSIPLEESSLVTRTIRDGEPLMVNDVSEDEDWMPNPLLPYTRSELVVPLRVGGGVIGALDVQSRTPGSFTPRTVALFQTMAEQVAMNFATTDLLARTTEQAETLTRFTTQLRTAADVTERLSAILDPDQLLNEVVETLHSRFGLYHAHVYLLETPSSGGEAGDAQLVVRAGSGEVGKILCERGHRISLDAAKSLVARAARDRATVYVEDTSTKSDFMPNPLLPQTRSEVAMPLIAGDQMLGVLDIQDDQPGHFTESELDTFVTLAGQVATTLQNAYLFGEQKRAEETIRESQQRFQGLVENLSDWIWEVDPNGVYTYVSPKVTDLLGYQPEEVLGKTPFDFMPADEVERVAAIFGEIVAGQKPIEALENTNIHKDGHLVVFETTGTPAFDAQGNFQGYRGTDRDITERVRAEAALRESQQMLQLIMNNIPHSIFWKDKDLAYLGCNRNFARDAGKESPEELIGKTDFDMPWLDQAELYRADDRRVMEADEPVLNYEEPQTTPDGSQIWLRTSKVPLHDATGDVMAVLGLYEDVTAEKQAEQILRESEERFRGLYESSPLGIILNDYERGDYLEANDAFVEMMGYTLEELNQLSYFDVTPQKYEADEAEQIRSMEETGRYGPYEKEYIRKDGSLFPVVLNGVLVTDSRGRKLIWSTVADITERKRAEQERERFTNQLRTAADLTEQVNAILDPDQLLGEVVTQLHDRFNLYHVHVYLLDQEVSDSAAGRALVLRAGSGEIGRVMLEREHKIPLDREQSLVARAARTGEIVHAADTAREADFMPNPLLPETRSEVAVPLMAGDRVLGILDVQDNQPGRFTQSDLDIFSTLAGQISTALQNAGLFEEVQQTAERLREVDRLKSEFLANMSHELRTPLNSILGYTEVMLMGLNGDLDPDTQEDVQAIYDNGQHLLRLINDILDLAKIEAGRMALNIEDVEIAPLLEDIKTNSAGLLVNKPVEMILEMGDELPSIKADHTRVNQILTNLVSNAAKFTEQGQVTLRAFCEDDEWICLEVQDTGIGIQEADLENIFEQFRQADGSFKRRAEGTGLGLAITRHLVTMHGGTISVHSQVGSGSTFTVRLPTKSRVVEAISGSSDGQQA